MKSMGKIPVGWMAYASIGNQVPGTRFIAFKVPLREDHYMYGWIPSDIRKLKNCAEIGQAFVDKLKADDRFTVPLLLERVPELGLIIDLTQTLKYYDKNEVLDRGVDYVKIPTPGQSVPAQQYVDRFFEVVDYYLDSHKNDDSLIGVHCTHGVNRTGYMLCRYLIQRLGYNFEDAISAVGTARGHPIERSHYLTSLRDHRETVLKKTTRGDLEEGKSKMSKKSVIKPPKKSTETRATVPGKERFARRQEHFPRDDQRSRSPRRQAPGQFGDFGPSNRGMMNRERMPPQRGHTPPPHHVRGRTPPPQHHMRGNTPPHMRGRSPPRMQPPYMRGGTPPHMRPRTPPHQGYITGHPPHMRRSPPPQHRPPPPQMRGRSPPRGPPPPPHMRGRSPPGPVRGRTPPPMRGRSPPPYHPHPDMGMGRNPNRGRTPPPGHIRERTPPYHGRGRTPPPMRGRTPPPMPRDTGRRSPGGYPRREGPPPGRRSPPRAPPSSIHEPPHVRRDYFPPGRRTPPPSTNHGPPPIRQRTPPARREQPPQPRMPPDEYYRAEYSNKRAPPIDEGREYRSPSKYQNWPGGYSGGEPGSSSDPFTDYYGQQRRERSRSPHRREDAAYYPERRKEMSPPRDIKRRRKSPNALRDKSMGSPPRFPPNGREARPSEQRGGYPEDYWNRNPQDESGPDCREILNERRSGRDPYPDPEFDDRKRPLAERLPPKNVDLRESLEEEKRRKQQGFVEPYGDYERKNPKRQFPEYEPQNSRPERGFDEHRYGDFFPEGQPEGGDFNKVSDEMRDRRGPGNLRGGKRVFERLSRGKRGSGFRK